MGVFLSCWVCGNLLCSLRKLTQLANQIQQHITRIMHHETNEVNLVMLDWLYIQRSINVLYYINKIRNKTYTIFPRGSVKKNWQMLILIYNGTNQDENWTSKLTKRYLQKSPGITNTMVKTECGSLYSGESYISLNTINNNISYYRYFGNIVLTNRKISYLMIHWLSY